MLGEGVDTAPSRNHKGVKELLAASAPPQPQLSNQEQDGEENAVCYECAAHDEMCQTLAGVIRAAEAHRGDASQHELNPAHNGHELADPTMRLDDYFPDLSMDSSL